MGRRRRLLFGSTVVVAMVVSASCVRVEAGTAFHVSCTVADTVDPGRAAAICAEFISTAKAQPDLMVTDHPAPLTVGPGLEIRVEGVGDTSLDLAPTWVGAEGNRTTEPSVGLRVTDTAISERLRRDFYLRLLARTPK